MTSVTRASITAALFLSSGFVRAQEPDAATIMARVADGQDRSEIERTRYTYVQHADVASHKGHKILCREVTDSRVTPSGTGSGQELLTLDGRLWLKNRYVNYTHLLTAKLQPGEVREVTLKDDDDVDVNLVEHLRDNLTNAKAKDGFNAGLFPLSHKAQASYDYRLTRHEQMNGRDTWLVHFKPKNNQDFAWEGDAWIDTTAYQPVLVRTRLSRRVPFLVKTMLGTNVPGLGFAVTYQPQPDGVWFPVRFGTEFKIHVLFFFSRQVTMDVRNNEFQKTHSDARILSLTEAAADGAVDSSKER